MMAEENDVISPLPIIAKITQDSKLPTPGSPSKRTASFRDRKPVLSDLQRTLLRNSWSKVGKVGPSGIGTMIFKRIFERCPSARKMFGFTTVNVTNLSFDGRFQRHAKVFVGVLEKAVKNLDTLETSYASELIQTGGNHVKLANLGFRMEFWDVFAEGLTESAMEWTGPGKAHKETVRAWTILVAFIINQMRFGYELELKSIKKSLSPVASSAQVEQRMYDLELSPRSVEKKKLSSATKSMTYYDRVSPIENADHVNDMDGHRDSFSRILRNTDRKKKYSLVG